MFSRSSILRAACATFFSAAAFTGLRAEELPAAAAASPSSAPAALMAAATPAIKPDATIENSVVKIFSTVRYPDPYRPWTKQAPQDFTGSGAVIAGHRILTNAHVVLYASQIQVQANQAGDKISATVEFLAPGIDLAVLKLDDDSFFDSHAPLSLAKTLPDIKDPVLVYGYPQGGTSMSITKGIVSRIEFDRYNGTVFGLRIQIDAAINPGNSGGPAIAGDHVIGLAFSRLQGGAENIGYIIPSEEIELFLHDVADGRYDGKPTMFDNYQTLENPALRAFLKLDHTVSGVIVNQPDSDAADYPLKPWDAITKIGDTPIDDEGMVRLGDLRVSFPYMVQKIARDGKVPLTLVRTGKEIAVDLPVSPDPMYLFKDYKGGYPSYFVYGPLAFTEASELYLGALSGTRNGAYLASFLAQGNPLISRVAEKQSYPGERLVVVSSPFFPHPLAKGYSSPIGRVVKTVNHLAIQNLEQLVEVLRDSKEEFITIEFAGRGYEAVVFPRAQMVSATDEILTDNSVLCQGSPDTLAVWNKK